MIDSYEFGEIVIDGKSYTSDVIIYPQRIDSNWWRKKGHELSVSDLKDVVESRPEIIVVGTGSPGLMKVPPETERYIKSKGIELVVQPTREACRTYNQLCNNKKIVAMLHITC
jgi:hypothetical protein